MIHYMDTKEIINDNLEFSKILEKIESVDKGIFLICGDIRSGKSVLLNSLLYYLKDKYVLYSEIKDDIDKDYAINMSKYNRVFTTIRSTNIDEIKEIYSPEIIIKVDFGKINNKNYELVFIKG